MLTVEGSRSRQERLRAVMERNRWDVFVTCNYRTVYYLSGLLSPPETAVILLLHQDGRSVLVTSTKGNAAVDEIILQESYSIQRSLTRPWHDATQLLLDCAARTGDWRASRAGVEVAGVPLVVAPLLHGAIQEDATDAILRMRKRKDADEIDEIRQSLRYCAVAYDAAKRTIAPGKTEVDIYNAMAAAISTEAGTTIAFPGDFACGPRGIRGGGAPTGRVIQEGDLYILDLFPAPALYAGDTCRTFCAGKPTDLQQRAWEIVKEALGRAERSIRPGVAARDAYREAKVFLDSHEIAESSFWHHLGHGIGHHGHEAPRIIPGSEDIFEAGDVIAIEPGVYSEKLQGGIRLENNYVVRENGLERLFDFPLDLV